MNKLFKELSLENDKILKEHKLWEYTDYIVHCEMILRGYTDELIKKLYIPLIVPNIYDHNQKMRLYKKEEVFIMESTKYVRKLFLQTTKLDTPFIQQQKRLLEKEERKSYNHSCRIRRLNAVS